VPALVATAVSKRYGATEALRGVDLEVQEALFRDPEWATADELLVLHQRLAGSAGGAGECEEPLGIVGLAGEPATAAWTPCPRVFSSASTSPAVAWPSC
jgi:hypothetical protein